MAARRPRGAPGPDDRGLTKRFPGVVAVDGVDLDIAPARSSRCSVRTAPASRPLIQILAGVHPPGSYAGDDRAGRTSVPARQRGRRPSAPASPWSRRR